MSSHRTQQSNRLHYDGHTYVTQLTGGIVLCGLMAQCYNLYIASYPTHASVAALTCSLTALGSYYLYFKHHHQYPYESFTTHYLLSTLMLLISWRISVSIGMVGVTPLMCIASILKLFNYILCARNDLKEQRLPHVNTLIHNTKLEWQLLFIRMVIGFIFIPHFTEKLFAGPEAQQVILQGFEQLGFTRPQQWLYIAGLIELAGCFSIGCGFLTRLGAIGVTLYLLIATYLGHHFSAGFIWSQSIGGWEYPVLWSLITFSFVCFGSNHFSLDRVIEVRYPNLPRWIKILMS